MCVNKRAVFWIAEQPLMFKTIANLDLSYWYNHLTYYDRTGF